MAVPDVNWQRLREEVGTRIDILEAAWNDALKRGPLGEKIINDLYMRLLEMIASFCASIEITQEPRAQRPWREPGGN